jgi:amino acid transporter
MSDVGRRRLGTTSLAAIVVANMIGAGVFTTSGFALADLGSPGRVMAAWAIGGVIALTGAVCYGALAMRMSESGGEYLFLSRSLHPFAGFLAGWVSLLAGFTGAIAVAAEAAQAYLEPWLPAGMPLDLVGTLAIVATGLLHARGVGPGARVQNTVVAVKMLLLLALVGVGWSSIPATETAPASGSLEVGAFVTTLMWVSLSYSGWNAAVYVAGEARDPERSLPRALLGGTVLVTVLYLGLNWVFVHAAPVEALAGKRDIAAVAAEALGGARLEGLVRVILVLALLTSISSMVMIAPRVYAKMADDGVLPRVLAFTGEAPRAAIAMQVGLAVTVLWASGLRELLTNLGWILSAFTGLTVWALVRLRRREGAEAVPVWGYPWVPGLFLVMVVVLTVTMVITNAPDLRPTAGVLSSGVAAYFLLGRKR